MDAILSHPHVPNFLLHCAGKTKHASPTLVLPIITRSLPIMSEKQWCTRLSNLADCATPSQGADRLHSRLHSIAPRFWRFRLRVNAPAFIIFSMGSITRATLMMSDAQAGQGMQGPGPGPGQLPVRRPHDPRMRGADPRQQAHPRPAQPIQQPQPNPQPQQVPAANLPAEQQKGTSPVDISS